MNLQRRHDARMHVLRFQRILNRKRVHDGCEHAHVVAGHTIHAGSGQAGAPKDIATADYDGDFDTTGLSSRDLGGNALNDARLDTVVQFTHQRLSAEFQQYATVSNRRIIHRHALSSADRRIARAYRASVYSSVITRLSLY